MNRAYLEGNLCKSRPASIPADPNAKHRLEHGLQEAMARYAEPEPLSLGGYLRIAASVLAGIVLLVGLQLSAGPPQVERIKVYGRGEVVIGATARSPWSLLQRPVMSRAAMQQDISEALIEDFTFKPDITDRRTGRTD